MLAKEDLDVVFIQETKVRASLFSSQKFNVSFANRIMADFVGRSGGLAFLWKKDLDFNVVIYSPYHIHGEMWTLGENADRTD